VRRLGFLEAKNPYIRPAVVGTDTVLKLHHFSPDIAAEIAAGGLGFYSFRDPRDVAVSAMRQFNIDFDTILGWLGHAAEAGTRWENTRNVVPLRYESFYDDLPGMIGILSRETGVAVDEVTVRRLCGVYSPEEQRRRSLRLLPGSYDLVSLIHRDHIGAKSPGSWREHLSSVEASRIEESLGQWMDDHGYAVDRSA
jgi:hypothetical protein